MLSEVLSTSNDVAGTWKHFSAASTLAKGVWGWQGVIVAWFGHLVVFWRCGHGRWVHCCQRSGTVKTPQIDDYKVWEALWGWWGVGMVVGMVVGFAAWVCHGCGGWCDCYFIARVHKNEKDPVNIGLQGW